MAKVNKKDEQAPAESADAKEEVAEAVAEVAPRAGEYKDWIKMSEDEMILAQENGTLCGYHPKEGLGLVKVKETKKK